MKRFITSIILMLAVCHCFAVQGAYKNERYDILDKEEQYETIITEIEQAGEGSYTASDYFYLGLAYFRMENDEMAQSYFTRAVQVAPDFWDAYYYLAGSCYFSGKRDEAISHYEKCIELDASLASPYEILGHLYTGSGDYQKALQNYSKYYEMDKSPEATYNMAYTLYELKELDKAKPYVKSYLKHDKDSFSMNNIMVVILYSQGQYKKAGKYEKKLREIRKTTDDESIKGRAFFIIHSFSHNGYDVDVYEKFDQEGIIYYPLICDVKSEGKLIKTVNLEYDGITAERGCPYFVGIDEMETETHCTTNIGFRKYPKYEDFLKYVRLAIDGELEISASSQVSR